MKKVCSLALAVCLLLGCFACSNVDQEAIYSSALEEAQGDSSAEPEASSQPQGDEPDESGLSGELKISAALRSSALDHWADRFMEEHPGVKVSVEYTVDNPENLIQTTGPNTAIDWYQVYVERIAVDLASGEAADIVDLDLTPIYRFAASGLLEDLYQWMDNDPQFDKDEYYTNLFQAVETREGELPFLPFAFTFSPIYLNQIMISKMEVDVEEEYPDGLGWRDLVDLFQKALETGVADEKTMFAKNQNKRVLDGYELTDFISLNTLEASFDSPEWTEYLEATDQLPFERLSRQSVGISYNVTNYGVRDYFFSSVPVLFSHLNYWSPIFAVPNSTMPLQYRTEKGNYVFDTAGCYAIPAGGDNVELAWEFLKFLVERKDYEEEMSKKSTEGQENPLPSDYSKLYGSSIPVNRNALEELCQLMFGKSGPTVFERADEMIWELNVLSFFDANLGDSLAEIQSEFYDSHLITAEECAQQMQERAEIYLKE